MRQPLIIALGCLSLACGSKPDTTAYECTRQANLFEACHGIWETEYFVAVDCLETASPSWYDENGDLQYQDEDVSEEFKESLRDDCETFDDWYQSCLTVTDARQAAMGDSGNTDSEEEVDPELTKLVDDLDCVGYLAYYGMIEE